VLAFVTQWESRTSGAMCGMRATAATRGTIVGKELRNVDMDVDVDVDVERNKFLVLLLNADVSIF